MTNPADIANMKGFLAKFSAFERGLMSEKVEADKKAFVKLFDQFRPLAIALDDKLQEIAPRYNVFDILNIRHYEARVHTPFLAHLLRPDASHLQGRLFFDLIVGKILADDFDPAAITNIEVFEELSIPDGRMDIFVKYHFKGKKRVMVIENKIYHIDTEKQLEKYYDYLIKTLKLKTGDFHLVYLKPNRGKPDPISLPEVLYDQLKKDKSFIEIGYKQDLLIWLPMVLEKIKAPVVRSTLHQYIETIKLL